MQIVPVLALLTVSLQPLSQPEGRKPVLDVCGDAPAAGTVARLGTVRYRLVNSVEPGAPRFRIVWGNEGNAIALTRDARFLVARSEVYKERTDGSTEQIGTRLRFMDLSNGTTHSHVISDHLPSGTMQYAPDGQTIIFSSDSQIATVDAKSGKLVKKLDIGKNYYRDAVTAALSHDGKLVAMQKSEYLKDVPVEIWDLQTGKQADTLPGRGASCRGLAFAADGKRLLLVSVTPASVSKDGIGFGEGSKQIVACIDVAKRKIIAELSQQGNVTLGPDGETIAIESVAKDAIHIKHLPSGKERCVIQVGKSEAAFLPDGKSLLTIDMQGKATLWDVANGKKIRELEGSLVSGEQRILGFSSDGKTIVAVAGGYSSASFIVLWNAQNGKRLNRADAHEASITSIAYSSDGKLLASGSLDKTVRLWNVASAEHLRLIATHREAVTSLVFSPDGKELASSTYYGVTRVSRVADGKTIAEFTGPTKGARSLTYSADGKTLFAGGASEMLAWNLESRKEIVRLDTGDKAAVLALAKGGSLALTSESGFATRRGFEEREEERLKLWDPMRKHAMTSMSLRHEERGSIMCDVASFAPDNRIFASSQISEYQGIRPYYGGVRLQLWERASGQPIRLLGPVLTPYLAFSPDSRILAASGVGHAGHLFYGYGSGIVFWDTLTGRKVATLPWSPNCVQFSPDGSRVAVGGSDHCVHILDTPPPLPTRLADVPTPKQRDAWWTALAGEAKDAYKAIGEMVDSPKSALIVLKDRVKPVPPPEPATIDKLIAQLDSGNFADRAKAQAALETVGDTANDRIKKALEGNISLEHKRRLEEILVKNQTISATYLRQHRAIAILEFIGDSASRALLKSIAAGAPRARLTLEAQEALNRLDSITRQSADQAIPFRDKINEDRRHTDRTIRRRT